MSKASDKTEQTTRNELVYSADLNTSGYYFKWKHAKEMIRESRLPYAVPDDDGIKFWLAVRRCYLELGGEYKDGTRC